MKGKANKMNPRNAPVTGVGQRTEAVIYARVSSKDQEREGFSIPAQRELLGRMVKIFEATETVGV